MVSIAVLQRKAELPSDAEIVRLIELGCKRHPELRPDPNERTTYAAEFARAIEFLAYQQRLPEPHPEYDARYFEDLCARAHPLSYARHLKPFMAAVIASRVVYCGRHPHWSIGLGLGSQAMPDMSWQETLRSGAVPEPTPSRFCAHAP